MAVKSLELDSETRGSDTCDTVDVIRSMSVCGQRRQLSVERSDEMAMPQRDEKIEAIKRLDALLEYAVMHNDESEAARLRTALRRLTEEV